MLPEVGDEVSWWPSSRTTSTVRWSSAAYSTASTPCPKGRSTLIDAGTGEVNRRSLVSRKGHRLDLADASGNEGIRAATTDDKLTLVLDHSGATITLHADGKVEIKGTRASPSTRPTPISP